MLEQFSFVTSVATVAGIYAILAIGLNVHWGEAGLLNFGHVAFFAVGAYTSALLTIASPSTSQAYSFGFGMPIPFGIVGGCIAAGIIAFLMGIPHLKFREDYFAVFTIGLA